jgi:hypothetical protein
VPGMGVLRRHRLSIACYVLAGTIGVVAIADHRNKAARMNRAEVAEWFCAHEGTRCGGPSSRRIEEHWNERQWGYEIAVTALAGFAVIRFAYRVTRR